ncbi:hypothetical protein GEMRC1_002234 [Eukaryota sp. GEM-RC1]
MTSSGLANSIVPDIGVLATSFDDSTVIKSKGKVIFEEDCHSIIHTHSTSPINSDNNKAVWPLNDLILVVSFAEDSVIRVRLMSGSGHVFYVKKISNVLNNSVLVYSGHGRFVYSYVTDKSIERKVVAVEVVSREEVDWNMVGKIKKEGVHARDFHAVSQLFTTKFNIRRFISQGDVLLEF